MITDYFFYGSAVEQPPTLDRDWFQAGLYSPVVDRLVLVHNNEHALRRTALLWSSRLDLVYVRLDRADNFTPGLVDNDVCLTWTVRASKGMDITRFPTTRSSTIWADTLVNVADLDRDDLIAQNIQYLWATVTWLYACDNLVFNPGINRRVDFEYADLLGFPFQITDLEREISRIIYREFDFSRAQQQITQLFQQYEFANIKKITLHIDQKRS